MILDSLDFVVELLGLILSSAEWNLPNWRVSDAELDTARRMFGR